MTDVAAWLDLLVVLLVGAIIRSIWRCLVTPSLARRVAGWRLLRPRTPADCPVCRQTPRPPVSTPPTGPTLRPWREVKSRRGAPKRIATRGHACPNPTCSYAGVTDEAIHALVADGHHGRRERIQDYRCQACGARFSARRDTPLYRLKTASPRVAEVLGALAEGVDVAAGVRIFGHGEGTITRWLRRAGCHARALHERSFRQLRLPHVQLDELRTRLRRPGGVLWLWVASDVPSKAVPVLHLGARTRAAAQAVIHQLHQRLAPGGLPVFTSDGLGHYYGALTAHFGQCLGGAGRRAKQWRVTPGLLYARLRKTHRQRRLVRVVPQLCAGTWPAFRAALQRLGLRGTANTAFAERLNLTLRQGVPALARRTWSTAQTPAGLLAQLEWWRGYYHWCRPHAGLRLQLARPVPRGGRRTARRWRPRTPAMALGLTGRRWTTQELLLLPLPPPRRCAAQPS